MAERQIVDLVVEGSSPFFHPKSSTMLDFFISGITSEGACSSIG